MSLTPIILEIMPTIAYAQDNAPANVSELIGRINQYLVNPIIMFLFALAFVMFIYGLFNFFKNKDSAQAVEQGKRHMTWGIIGMFIMVSVFSIMNVIINTLQVEGVDPESSTVVDLPIDGE